MGWSGQQRIALRSAGCVFNKILSWVGYLALSGMVLVTTANVFGRYIFKRPLLGEIDMVELGMAVLGGYAMFLAAIQRHHVSVDVLIIRFSRRTQLILGSLASLLGFVTWGLLAYRVFLEGLGKLENGNRTATLFILQGPFEVILSVGILLFCLVLLTQVFHPEAAGEKGEGGPPL